MKKLFSIWALLFFFTGSVYAGTPMILNNKALGFSLIQYTQGEVDMDICSGETCFSFNQSKIINNNTVEYKEINGKCTLTVETFNKDFATGNTKEEFMLSLFAFVVKATKGDDGCRLEQKSQNKMRSLTGIYL